MPILAPFSSSCGGPILLPSGQQAALSVDASPFTLKPPMPVKAQRPDYQVA